MQQAVEQLEFEMSRVRSHLEQVGLSAQQLEQRLELVAAATESHHLQVEMEASNFEQGLSRAWQRGQSAREKLLSGLAGSAEVAGQQRDQLQALGALCQSRLVELELGVLEVAAQMATVQEATVRTFERDTAEMEVELKQLQARIEGLTLWVRETLAASILQQLAELEQYRQQLRRAIFEQALPRLQEELLLLRRHLDSIDRQVVEEFVDSGLRHRQATDESLQQLGAYLTVTRQRHRQCLEDSASYLDRQEQAILARQQEFERASRQYAEAATVAGPRLARLVMALQQFESLLYRVKVLPIEVANPLDPVGRKPPV